MSCCLCYFQISSLTVLSLEWPRILLRMLNHLVYQKYIILSRLCTTSICQINKSNFHIFTLNCNINISLNSRKNNLILVDFWRWYKAKQKYRGMFETKKSGTRQVRERFASTLEHVQVQKWDRTRRPKE